jgi:hypothetical protein
MELANSFARGLLVALLLLGAFIVGWLLLPDVPMRALVPIPAGVGLLWVREIRGKR